jgi:hypothetical protein
MADYFAIAAVAPSALRSELQNCQRRVSLDVALVGKGDGEITSRNNPGG